MKYAVKPFSLEYEGTLPELVGAYPITSLEVSDETVQGDLQTGWVLNTPEQRDALIAATSAAYEAWLAGQAAAEAAASAAATRTREVRFDTHDLSDISDWDGRTTGYPAAHITDAYPDAVYDDIRYRWVDPVAGPVAQLDGLVHTQVFDPFTQQMVDVYTLSDVPGGRKWRNPLDANENTNVLAEYRPDDDYPTDKTKGGWFWTADDTNVTSSLWLIDPYNGTKVNLTQVKVGSEHTALLQANSCIRYQVKVTTPYGRLVVAEYVYNTINKLVRNANGNGGSYKLSSGQAVQEYLYTYTEEDVITIDSAYGMTLEISLGGDKPVLNSETSYASFYGQEIGQRQV